MKRLLPILAIIVAAGCASRHYTVLLEEFETGQQTAYLAHATLPGAPATASSQPDIAGKIAELREQWQTETAATSAAPAPDVDLTASVTLANLLALVPARNPAVQAAREQRQAILQQLPQATYLDDILRQYNAFTKQLDTRVGRQPQKQIQAMSFPFPDALALKGKLIDEEAAIAELDIEIAVRDAWTDLREAYYEHQYIEHAIKINDETLRLLEQAIEVAQAKLRVNRADYNAVLRAQVELARITDRIDTLSDEQEGVLVRLNSLLSRPPDAPWGELRPTPEPEPLLPLPEIYEIALDNRQELEQLRLRRQRLDTMIELARRMTYPDASTGSSYFENRMKLSGGTEERPPGFMTTRTVSPAQAVEVGQGDAYLREIGLRGDALKSRIAALEDRTRFAVKQAHVDYLNATRRAELYRRSLLPQASQATETSMTAYEAGKTDFLTFLDAQRNLLDYRLEAARAERDRRTKRARLEQLAGRPLTSRSEETSP